MPRSRDVDAYPDMLKIAALMAVHKDFYTGWMEAHKARSFRQRYYAFVRAHYATIERTLKTVDNLKLGAKSALAEERIAPARNLLLLNRARESRLDLLKRFEATIEMDLDPSNDSARVRFRDKEIAHADAGIDELFAALPPEQRRSAEEVQMFLEAAPQRAPIEDPTPSLRDDPMLASFFSMPISEKIRIGAAMEEDFAASTLPLHELRALVLAVENVEWRERMLQCLPPLAPTLEATPPQLDTPGALAHTGLALGGVSPDILDEFLDSKPESQSSTQEETENGST